MKVLKSMLGAGLNALLGAGNMVHPAHRYQMMKPITTKNIGRRYFNASRYMPHQGNRERARRVRQRQEA